MSDYKKLEVGKRALELTRMLYRSTDTFPKTEMFGLTSQIRRAAASINANLAEGCSRGSDRELARFVNIAVGSVSELEYHLVLARDLGSLNVSEFEKAELKRREVGAMLIGLARNIKQRISVQLHEAK